jgi:hypothetical protein
MSPFPKGSTFISTERRTNRSIPSAARRSLTASTSRACSASIDSSMPRATGSPFEWSVIAM